MSGGSINPLTVLGAIGGAASSGNSSTSVNRDPWGPAQPYIQANIDSASRLQNYYQNNPLSPIQQRAYANSFAGTDNARQGLSMLSSQLGQNQGWSRNSGSRLPQGYNFLPLGVTGGGSGGGLTGGLPTSPFSGGGIIPASPTGGASGGATGGANSGSGGGNAGGQAWDGGGGQRGYLGNWTDKDWADYRQMQDMGLDTGGGYGLLGMALSALTGSPLGLLTSAYQGGTSTQNALTNFQDAKSANGGGTSSTATATGGGVVANPMGVDPAQAAVAALNGVAAAPEVRMVWDHDSKMMVPVSYGGDGSNSLGSARGAWTGGGGYVTGTGGYGKPGEAGGGFATGGGWNV